MSAVASTDNSNHEGSEYYVSPAGSDLERGSIDAPFATLARAAEALQPGDTCFLRGGIYRETLRPARSGLPGREITFTNYPGEQAMLSGADPIRGWVPVEAGIYAAEMPWSLADGNQIFADGDMLTEACWPDAGREHLFKPVRAVASGGGKDTLICKDIPGSGNDWNGARLWCAGGEAWICWSATVTGFDAATGTLTFSEARDKWYIPKSGNLFVLFGARCALNTPGEWLYETAAGRLLLIPPAGKDIENISVEAKRRQDVIDLSGRCHIRIHGLEFRAGGIRTDENSAHLVLEKLRGEYVAHSYSMDTGPGVGVLIRGQEILVLSCDFGYSSGAVLAVGGSVNRVINCSLHHGGYAGLWNGPVALSGRRLVFSHNTVRHGGRDLINTFGLKESLVQYNEVSDSGWLTCDLGMFYGHGNDFANSVFRYNLVHDNHARRYAMGIYFDHCSHNAIVHHNAVWNVGSDPIRFNNPSYGNLVLQNSCWHTGEVGTFDHSGRDDLFGCRYENNIFNTEIRLPAHVVQSSNLVAAEPPYLDPAGGDFRLREQAAPGLGAVPPGMPMWKAGCDPAGPPDPLPVYSRPRIPWMNLLGNSCFEFGTLEFWEKIEAGQAELCDGNGWGNGWGTDTAPHATGTSRYELRLGPGRDGVCQTVEGLEPETEYTLCAWARVSDESESVAIGVKDHGEAEVTNVLAEKKWTRTSIVFRTGPHCTKATVFLLKTTAGKGFAWCDNLSLPLAPAANSTGTFN